MTTGGMATALALAGGGSVGEDGVEDEADLFGDAIAPAVEAPPRSGPKGGRPAGARNRSTEQWRQYLLSKYPHPLETLLALTTRKPVDLARELGLYKFHEGKLVKELNPATGELVPVLDTGAATKVLVDAASAALPYIAQKQPLAIEAKGKIAGVIVIGDMAGLQDGGDGTLTIDVVPVESEQNQQLSEGDGVRLTDAQSDADANRLTSKEESR